MSLQTRRQIAYLDNAGISFKKIILKYEEKPMVKGRVGWTYEEKPMVKGRTGWTHEEKPRKWCWRKNANTTSRKSDGLNSIGFATFF